jgi:hypothetical protein
MTNEQKEKLLNDLAEDFLPFVKEVESGIKTTKNHYGRYWSMLSQLSKGNEDVAKMFALAMRRAGANSKGLASALNLCLQK